MKRFLLIEAQSLREYEVPFYNVRIPVDVVQPLGLLQIASIIRQRDPAAEVRILDLRLLRNDYSTLPAILGEFSPEFVGFRTVSRDASFMTSMVKTIRDLLPGAVLVGGGPHVTAVKEKIMHHAPFDFAVCGEGEAILASLLDHLEEGGGYERIAGLIFRDSKGEIHLNPHGGFIQDIDSIPRPAWDLLDHEQYFEMNHYPHIPISIQARREAVSMITSRGCPYHCIYCHNIFGKKFRARSPENVVDEMEYLHDTFGIRQFDIRDDIFNLDKRRAHRICDLILARGLDLKFCFPNGLRADTMDEALLLKMKEAGLYRLSYALETASPRLQKLIRKNIDLEKLEYMIYFTSSQGIITDLFAMLGFPTETREEMMMTVDFALNPYLDYIHVFPVNPFDGTEMAELLRKEGVEVENFRDKYDYDSVEFSVCELTMDEIKAIRDDLLKRFLTVPRMTRMMEKLKCFTR